MRNCKIFWSCSTSQIYCRRYYFLGSRQSNRSSPAALITTLIVPPPKSHFMRKDFGSYFLSSSLSKLRKGPSERDKLAAALIISQIIDYFLVVDLLSFEPGTLLMSTTPTHKIYFFGFSFWKSSVGLARHDR